MSSPSSSRQKRPSAANLLSRFLSQEDLRFLEQTSFLTTQRIRGLQTGIHKARLRGGTTEFSEHRPYTPGDEIRRLDWRVAGRSDKLEIKLYDDPSTLGTVVLLDASGSMAFSDSTRTKFDYGCSVTAFLAKLLLGQRDPVGLLLAGDETPDFLWPKSSTGHFLTILNSLRDTEPEGKTKLAEGLRFLSRNLRNPTRVIIVSDAFADLSTLEPEISRITGKQHRFHFLQVLAPEEVGFNYRQPLRFSNLEGSDHLDANPQEMASAYLEAIEGHIAGLRKICLRYRGGYEPLVTDQPVGQSLVDFIRRNSQRKQ